MTHVLQGVFRYGKTEKSRYIIETKDLLQRVGDLFLINQHFLTMVHRFLIVLRKHRIEHIGEPQRYVA